MDDAGGTVPPRDEAGPDGPAERTSGIILETCYRHPRETTGVHCTRCGRPICPECMRPAAVGYQCPECVAEARASFPRRRVQVKFVLGRPGALTTSLLAINLAMFVVEVAVGGARSLASGPSELKLFNLGAMYPPAIAHGQYWRLFTAMFLHAGLVHIAFNMYALYLFGYLIEEAFGKVRFLLIYLVAGLLASVASYTFSDPHAVAVGASGAIFGLLGAWVAYNYRRRGTPAAAFQLRWALMLIGINLILGFSIAIIDNNAHIGGLIAGIAAGTLADGIGPRSTRALVQVLGFAALIGIGVVMTIARTAALT
ncbi:MAG TPA: rhomboid family intramembrane serine protease [Actinomycetota bacterium]